MSRSVQGMRSQSHEKADLYSRPDAYRLGDIRGGIPLGGFSCLQLRQVGPGRSLRFQAVQDARQAERGTIEGKRLRARIDQLRLEHGSQLQALRLRQGREPWTDGGLGRTEHPGRDRGEEGFPRQAPPDRFLCRKRRRVRLRRVAQQAHRPRGGPRQGEGIEGAAAELLLSRQRRRAGPRRDRERCGPGHGPFPLPDRTHGRVLRTADDPLDGDDARLSLQLPVLCRRGSFQEQDQETFRGEDSPGDRLHQRTGQGDQHADALRPELRHVRGGHPHLAAYPVRPEGKEVAGADRNRGGKEQPGPGAAGGHHPGGLLEAGGLDPVLGPAGPGKHPAGPVQQGVGRRAYQAGERPGRAFLLGRHPGDSRRL